MDARTDLVAAAIALVAAALFAAGVVLQQRAAAETPPDARGASLVRGLLGRRMWLGGMACEIVGYGCQAAALAIGSLALVQPLLVAALLFALPLGALWQGRRLRRSDYAWALVLTLALVVFIVEGDPTPGVDQASLRRWIPAGLVLTVLATACAVVAYRLHGARRALVLAVATGIFYGLTAALTKSVMNLLGDGLVDVLTGWETYALVVVAAAGTYLQQAAFQAGSLEASLPASTVLEPMVAVGVGLVVLEERVQAGGGGYVLVGAAVVAMVCAVVALSRSEARSHREAAVADAA